MLSKVRMALLLCLLTANASADDASQFSFWGMPVIGLATPVGILGAMLEMKLPTPLSLDIGAGYGASAGKIQFALMPRYSVVILDKPQRSLTLFLDFGTGISAGAYKFQRFGDGVVDLYDWNRAYWWNNEVSVTFSFHQGYFVRGFFGFGYVLNPNDGVPQPGPPQSVTCSLPNDFYCKQYAAYFGGAFGFKLY